MLANTTQNIIHKYWKRGNTKKKNMETHHTFSFGGFFDPERMGFRSLQGKLEHQDSLGRKSLIEAGEVGICTAKTSMSYKVLNPCRFKSTHFLSIWINANNKVQPKYQQQCLPTEVNNGKLLLLASPDTSKTLMTIDQDMKIYHCYFQAGDYVKYDLKPNRYAWLYMVRGVAVFNRKLLVLGDSVQIHDSQQLTITTELSAEFLLFDMA
jgi:quercetin 2,3-dioxygenase